MAQASGPTPERTGARWTDDFKDLSWGSRFVSLAVEAPSGLEPLSGASTPSAPDLSAAVELLRQLVQRLDES